MQTEQVRDLPTTPVGAFQILWKVTPPVRYGHTEPQSETEYVITSAVYTMFGPETYIFPANESGEVIDWGELPGSFQGDLDHYKAIENLDHEEIW